MSNKKKNTSKKSFFTRHWRLKHIFVGLIVLLIAAVLLLCGLTGWDSYQTNRRQNSLEPFYDTTGLAKDGPAGQLVRSEPLGLQIANGSGWRVLYRTQQADGTSTFSSGMVFVPSNSKSGTPRPVVAWAHGTVGMGDQCAPSRAKDPTGGIEWVSDMLAKGWVVTATDYAGLGTPGTEGYLVGGDEAHDVLNSVRAAENLPAAQAGNRFVVWGHSQGGHSALFTAAEASGYAPDLKLAGTVASAPAAELPSLLQETNGTALDWVIGPEVLVSWPKVYTELSPKAITTKAGYENYQRIADQCVDQSTLGALTRAKFKQKFFSIDPSSSGPWRAAAEQQTAPVLTPNQPLMVAESLTDKVVLPNTTALYMQRACQANSDLTSLWLTNVNHIQLQTVISPSVIGWTSDRFAGKPAISNCQQPLPITPASQPPT